MLLTDPDMFSALRNTGFGSRTWAQVTPDPDLNSPLLCSKLCKHGKDFLDIHTTQYHNEKNIFMKTDG